MEASKNEKKEINRKIYLVNGSKINRVEVRLIYDSDLKRYYISIQPQEVKKIDSIELVSVCPFDCARVLLQQVTRRTKKQDKIALDKFLLESDGLAEQMAKRFDAVLKG